MDRVLEKQAQAEFGRRWLIGMFGVIIVLFFVRVLSVEPEPPRRLVDDRLIASPSDPYMVEAIRVAQSNYAEDGPWGGAQRKQGPKITIQMPGGPITLTRHELADANHIYPQIKANPAILYGERWPP